MDVRMFTVGPVQENSFLVRASDGATGRCIVDPGEEARAPARAIDDARRRARRDPAHAHPLRPHRRRRAGRAGHRRPVYCPRARGAGAARHHGLRTRGRASARSRAGSPSRPSTGGERLELAGLDIDVLFTPGHSPGHVTYAIATSTALFSGDVLFQGSVGRTDLPGGDRAHAAAVDRRCCWSATTTRRVVHPGHMGLTTLGARARDATRSCSRRARSPHGASVPDGDAEAPGAARHLRRAARAGGRPPARRGDARASILERRRLPPHRDADLRGHRAVRARRRRVDRHRPEGDVHLRGRAAAGR